MKQLKFITIQQAVKADAVSLHVLNMARPIGNVNFNVSDATGVQIAVQVPICSIPVDLTMQAERDRILQNPNFRRLLARGFLKLVDEQSSLEFLDTPQAQKEYNRVNKVIQTDINELDNLATINNDVPVLSIPTNDGLLQGIDPFVQATIIGEESSTEEDVYTAFNSRMNTLSVPDLEYILNKSKYPSVKQFAADTLSLLED